MAEEKQGTKPEWMSQEDWEEIERLPASVQSNAIHLREHLSREKVVDLVDQATDQADVIHEEVTKASGPEQTSLAVWCGFPTDLTRCSPFFPLNPKELGHREFLRDYMITSAGWGEIKYTGPKLSTYEEDALMALLAILHKVSQERTMEQLDGRKTYMYRGPALPLLRLLGYNKPGKDAYKRLIAALKLLTVAGVELSISAGKTKSGKKRPPRITSMSAMLSNVYWDEDKKELTATVNPFFYETYYAGTVTLMDVVKRVSLKGAIAKALYRFVQSQQKELVFEGHFLTLADALNMDLTQPAFAIKRRLKQAIAELKRKEVGILSSKSKFKGPDIMSLHRENGTLPERKKKLEKNK